MMTNLLYQQPGSTPAIRHNGPQFAALFLAPLLVSLLLAAPVTWAASGKWPVESEFVGMDNVLDQRNISPEGLTAYMRALARQDDLLKDASVLVTEQKKVDVFGFQNTTGKASFVLTLHLENGVLLETRENICVWERLDSCLARAVERCVRIYRQMQRKRGVEPGSRLLNL